MNVNSVVSLLTSRLGDRTDLTTQALLELQMAQKALEIRIQPWFLLSENSSITTTAGEERIQLPLNFLAPHEDSPLFYVDATGEEFELKKADYRTMKATYRVAGFPQVYAFSGQYYRIGPTPDAVYTLKMIHFIQDVLPDGVIITENQWLNFAPELLIAEAGIRLAKYTRDDTLLAVFTAEAEQRFDELWRHNEELMHSNMDYKMEYRGENYDEH